MRRALAASVCAVVLMSCGSSSRQVTADSAPTSVSGAPGTANAVLLALWSWPSSADNTQGSATPTTAGMMALPSGVLRIDMVNGCIALEWQDLSRYPVVWPVGTRLNAANDRVVLRDGTEIRDGQLVTGAGGYLTTQTVREVVGISMELPAACRARTGEVIVFNPGERLTIK